MKDSSKSKDSTKLVVTDEIIEYFKAKYGNKWQLSSDEDSTTYEDSSSDDHMTVFKGKTMSSSKYLVVSARFKKADVGATAGPKLFWF
ncbi:hypothetical protein Tco_0340780 [Tanacetum coccineum]